MLSNFTIENYRLFDKIELNKLSQVNLIVGKNSSGKSALLEAILLYCSNCSLAVIERILTSRNEFWQPQGRFAHHDPLTHPIEHLFKGHSIPSVSEDGIKLSSGQGLIRLATAHYAYSREKNGVAFQRVNIAAESVNFADISVQLICELKGNVIFTLGLEQAAQDPQTQMLNTSHIKGQNGTFPQYVPTAGLSSDSASKLWDSVALTDLEAEVLKGLQIIEPNISGINFVEYSNKSRRRIPIVKIKKQKEPVSLQSLGDGMTRIFHIILSLVCAKDSVLVIDEFENGLHWSVQKMTWQLVYALAKDLNVQVFCSTHSRDCIDSFCQVWQENPDMGGFTRVYAEDNGTKIREYELALLNDSLEMDVEVR